jgi:hypothetical protein
MNINLSRDISLKKIELIAEVDFSDSNNPYHDLLKDIDTEAEMESSLKNIGMEDAEIKMIISKFKKNKIIKNGRLDKSFISTREYGKYEITYVENDRLVNNLPIEINRVKPGKPHDVTNISSSSIIKELNKTELYKSYSEKDKKFRIFKLEKNKENEYLGGNSKNAGKIKLKWSLDILNKKNTWYLEGHEINRIEETKGIYFTEQRINSLLDNNWDDKNEAMKITFDEIENNRAVNNFYLDFDKDITFDEFGDFNGEFKNIPIIPIDKNNALDWFTYLFKKHILRINRYTSFDELQQIWKNEFDKTPISKKFDLELDFNSIISQLKNGTKEYWQLMAGKDLNPFETISKKRQINNIIIKRENNIDVKTNILDRIIGYDTLNELTIVDTYITNDRHYNSLNKLVSSVRELNSNIVINVFTKQDDNEIIEKVKNLNINYNAINKKLPHNRLWIFKINSINHYFNVSHSLDFIKYLKNSNSFCINEDIVFSELEKNDVDDNFFQILGEDYE